MHELGHRFKTLVYFNSELVEVAIVIRENRLVCSCVGPVHCLPVYINIDRF